MARSHHMPATVEAVAKFRKLLQRELQARHLTARMVAKRSSLSQETIQMMCTGSRRAAGNISLWAIVGIADALDMKVTDILDEVWGAGLSVPNGAITSARDTVTQRLQRLTRDVIVPAVTVVQNLVTDTVDAASEIAAQVSDNVARFEFPSQDRPDGPRPREAVPSVLDLMVNVRRLDAEMRLLVDEFIKELVE